MSKLEKDVLSYMWVPSRVCANKIWFIPIIENTLYWLINTINCTGSFKYTVRTIANYVIAFVDRFLLVFGYTHAKEGGGVQALSTSIGNVTGYYKDKFISNDQVWMTILAFLEGKCLIRFLDKTFIDSRPKCPPHLPWLDYIAPQDSSKLSSSLSRTWCLSKCW